MRRINLGIVFITVLTLFSLVSCGQFKAKMEVKQGNDLYNGRKYNEAIQKYKSALKKAPDLYQIYYNLGLSYMALYVPGSTHPKDVEYANQAINAFKEYLKHKPYDEKVNGYLVQMYLNADRKQDAIVYFEDHLRKNPSDTAIIQKLAYLYAQTGKFDEALKWYKRRVSVEPNNAEAYYTIGVICWERSYKFPVSQQEREELINTGMQALEKATSINPNYADAYLYMNLLYREKAKLISLDPASVPEDKVDEYNALLQKAKDLQEKAMELKKKQPS